MTAETLDGNIQFLSGGGKMGALIRLKDWTKTPLGAIENWPQSLRSTLNIILRSKFPMFLWWGPDLLCFYNDAYRPSLGKFGKHPSILGIPAKEAWPEIWDIIYPLIKQVLADGESTWSEDQLIPIYRNGKLEDVYWTFSYSAVSDESGNTAGVLVTCSETTDKVNSANLLKESNDQLHFAIEAAELGTWDSNPLTHKFSGNARLEEWFGLQPGEEIDPSHVLDIIAEKDRQTVTAAVLYALQYSSGGHYDISYTIIHPTTGEERIVRAKGKAWFNVEKICYRFNGTLQDITAEALGHRKLEESEEKFRSLADSLPDLVWTKDSEGNFNYFSKAFQEYSGLDMEKLLKEGWLQIIHPDEWKQTERHWNDSLLSGNNLVLTHRFRRNDGQYRWHLSHATPQRNANGNIQMWVGASTDIQEIKELDEQKDYFISMLSHELRNPITTLSGYIQILQLKYKPDHDQFLSTSLTTIDKQVGKLIKLIADLLDVSKIKIGSLTYIKENFNLNQCIKEIVAEAGSINPEHEIIFSDCSDVFVFADKERIGQVIINLLTNAIKYSPGKNEVTVEMRVVEDCVVVTVQDNGIGINEKDQAKIFERFYRVEGKNEKKFPGFGIGLFIASEIIHEHKGKIGVKSKPGKGSAFYFSLPIIRESD
ncbi:MAG: PAS domain-containing sensor histidine kinase [Chitinophagaceae bacterium]